jgi:uncharacterized protein YggU (UPF0235/DUF167 family)
MLEYKSVYIHLRLKTGQKKELFKPLKEGYFEVWVKEKPKNNAANKRILEMVKTNLGAKSVKIINGHRSPSKLVSVII